MSTLQQPDDSMGTNSEIRWPKPRYDTPAVGGTDLGAVECLNRVRLQAEAAGVVGDDRLVMPKPSKE